MPPYKVTNVRQSTAPGGPQGTQRIMVVEYKVGDWGPYEVDIPADKFSPEEVARVVGAQAAHIAAVMGHAS